MRPRKPLEKGGGAGEKAWQSFIRGTVAKTLTAKPSEYRGEWEEAIEKGEVPFEAVGGPVGALLKRTVLREASKAAVRGRRGWAGALRKEFDETAKRLFRALRAFPEETFKPIEEVSFPGKIPFPGFGEVAGLVSYGQELKMQVALAPKYMERIAHTLRHEMTHVGQRAIETKDPIIKAMGVSRKKLFRETPTLEPVERWKLDPTEKHAEMFAEVMGRIIGRRKEKGPLSWEEYKTIFRETIPAEFLPRTEEVKRGLDVILGAPSPQVTKEATPERMIEIVERIAKTSDPSGVASAFGYKHRGSAKVGEALRKARKGILRKVLDKSIPAQERMEMGLPSQLLREALEEVEGRAPKGFSFLEVRAGRGR